MAGAVRDMLDEINTPKVLPWDMVDEYNCANEFDLRKGLEAG